MMTHIEDLKRQLAEAELTITQLKAENLWLSDEIKEHQQAQELHGSDPVDNSPKLDKELIIGLIVAAAMVLWMALS